LAGITGIASTTSKAYSKDWISMRSIMTIGSEIRESKTIASISTPYLDCPINVRSRVNYELDAAPSIGSTVGRELMYAVAHTIHHYALIAVMCGMLEVPVPQGFGVAPSTLKYHAEQPKAA
jgi:hypothetical protein